MFLSNRERTILLLEASGIEKASHLEFELMLGEGCETVKLITCQSAAVRALSLLLDTTYTDGARFVMVLYSD